MWVDWGLISFFVTNGRKQSNQKNCRKSSPSSLHVLTSAICLPWPFTRLYTERLYWTEPKERLKCITGLFKTLYQTVFHVFVGRNQKSRTLTGQRHSLESSRGRSSPGPHGHAPFGDKFENCRIQFSITFPVPRNAHLLTSLPSNSLESASTKCAFVYVHT